MCARGVVERPRGKMKGGKEENRGGRGTAARPCTKKKTKRPWGEEGRGEPTKTTALQTNSMNIGGSSLSTTEENAVEEFEGERAGTTDHQGKKRWRKVLVSI